MYSSDPSLIFSQEIKDLMLLIQNKVTYGHFTPHCLLEKDAVPKQLIMIDLNDWLIDLAINSSSITYRKKFREKTKKYLLLKLTIITPQVINARTVYDYDPRPAPCFESQEAMQR